MGQGRTFSGMSFLIYILMSRWRTIRYVVLATRVMHFNYMAETTESISTFSPFLILFGNLLFISSSYTNAASSLPTNAP